MLTRLGSAEILLNVLLKIENCHRRGLQTVNRLHTSPQAVCLWPPIVFIGIVLIAAILLRPRLVCS